MSTQKIRPGEVIGSALNIYREQASVLISVAVIVFAITALAQLALTGGPAVLVSLLGIVIVVFYQGMVVELVGDIQNGRRDSSVRQLFRRVAPVVLPLNRTLDPVGFRGSDRVYPAGRSRTVPDNDLVGGRAGAGDRATRLVDIAQA